jgi:CheY-like chemotaxis protein
MQTGVEAVKQYREFEGRVNRIRVKVVGITASALTEDVQTFMAVGCDEVSQLRICECCFITALQVLSKPVSFGRLMELVQQKAARL